MTTPKTRDEVMEMVARAICKSLGANPDKERALGELLWSLYTEEAEAALSVIESIGGWAPEGFWIAPNEAAADAKRAAINAMIDEHGICDFTESEVMTVFAAIRTCKGE